MAFPVAAAAMIGSAIASIYGQSEANRSNQQMANNANYFGYQMQMQNQDWQARMSNTAYQRAKDDLLTAGFNPALAYMQGGASSPTGGVVQGQQARVEDALGKGVGSALESWRNSTEGRKAAAQEKGVDSQAALNEAMGANQKAQEKANLSSAHATAIKAKRDETETKALEAQLPALKAEAQLQKKRAEFGSRDDVFTIDEGGKRLNQATGTISNVMDIARPKIRLGPQKEYMDTGTGEITKGRMKLP